MENSEFNMGRVLASALLAEWNNKSVVDLIIEIEKQAKSMDVTEPLYKYFKSVMEREDPYGL